MFLVKSNIMSLILKIFQVNVWSLCSQSRKDAKKSVLTFASWRLCEEQLSLTLMKLIRAVSRCVIVLGFTRN